MSNIIDSIRMSGTTYAISDSGGTKVVEITQSDYDNLPTSAKTANIMYVITDAEPFDVSNYYTKAETSGATELATAFAATQPKLSAGTNITIDANNVISAEGGGGKAVVGGRGITVTSGETADTINCTVPASASSGNYSIMFGQPASSGNASGSKTITGGQWSKAYAEGSVAIGQMNESRGSWAWAIGNGTSAVGQAAFACGEHNSTNNPAEFTCGYATITSGGSDTSIMTLFTVGNGKYQGGYQRHNALDIRMNGDIYISDTNSTSTSNYWQKPMIKLQDALGGGGGIDSGTVQTMIDQSISGKTNQTDFVSHSGNTTMHVTASEKSTWNAKSDFSGNYNDLSNKPTIPTSASQLTNDSGYITSSALNGYATEAYVTAATNDMATKTWVGQQGYLTQHQDISGKQDVSGMTAYTTTTTNTLSGTVTAHTADTTIHVTTAQTAAWNAKSDFSGSYNDLTDKPTIPTVPTNVSDFTNDAGYATSGYVQSVTSDMATKTWVGQQGYLTQHQDISGKQDVSGMTAYTETSAFTAHTANTTVHVTANEKSTWNAKSDFSGSYNDLTNKLSAGTNITIVDNVISASGGGNSVVELTQSEYDALVAGGTVDPNTFYVITDAQEIDTDDYYTKSQTSGASEISTALSSKASQNDLDTLSGNVNTVSGNVNTVSGDVVSLSGQVSTNTSNISTVSASTASNTTALGGLSLVKLTQSAYDALSPNYDSNTLYVIVN